MVAAWRRERPHSFAKALKAAREILSANPELVAKGSIEAEAEQLVCSAYRFASGKRLSRVDLYTRAQDRFPEVAGDKLLTLAGGRAEGKPLQHLTGLQVFLDHEYEVGPDVLIPRPETELMVNLALTELKSDPGEPALGIEIGIGSGAISVEMLARLPGLKMVATELTAEAESRAKVNARRILGDVAAKDRLQIVRSARPLDVLEPLEAVLGTRRADFLISNPPYLIATDPIEAEVVKYEPATALFAPKTEPLHFYREIASNAARYLVPRGKVFLELAPERSAETLGLFSGQGWKARILPDLTGRDRVLFASLDGKR